MIAAIRLACLASTLALAGCDASEPPACVRLGLAFCRAAGVDCAAAKALFEAAALTPKQCEEAIVTLDGVVPALTPDVRGHGLAAFLREVLRDSPKIDAARLDARARALGLPDSPAGPSGDPPAPDGPPGDAQPIFSDYGAVQDEAAARPAK